MDEGLPGLGRQRLILSDVLRRRRPVRVLVEGYAGSGKSTLLLHTVRMALAAGLAVGTDLELPGSAPAGAVPLPVAADEPGLPRLRDWLRTGGLGGKPALVVLDDVHRLPAEPAATLAALAQWHRDEPTTWVLSRTSGTGGAEVDRLVGSGRSDVVRLTLGRMTDFDTAELLADLLGRPPSARLVAAAGIAGGHRHLTVALVEGLRQEGRLTELEWAHPVRLPHRVHEVVGTLQRRLTPGCRRFLMMAAVGGERCQVGRLAEQLGSSVTTMLPAMTEAIEARVLVVRQDELAFAQPVFRQALLESVPAPVLRALAPVHRPVPLGHIPDLRVSSGEQAAWAGLSDVEQSIALLAGRGLTNSQIAVRICLSPHTVNYHLRKIYRKLDIRSRAQLAKLSRLGEAG